MQTGKLKLITAETLTIFSKLLKRNVKLNIYFPSEYKYRGDIPLLLINDGQDLPVMNFEGLLADLYMQEEIAPMFFAGIECGIDRRNEYGTAKFLDYNGRGTTAPAYQLFIFEEMLPFLKKKYTQFSFQQKSFCGFSMGGLSALDIVWNNQEEFKNVGVFSGSLWWRSVSQDSPLIDEDKDRIMHSQVKNGGYYPGLQFFFETGTKDETADRNNNGIIDSIDDTLSLINELNKKGYASGKDIFYLELKDGKHDVPTWREAFPYFLKWAWGKDSV